MDDVAKRLQEATLLRRKREEINMLKEKRKEKLKGPASMFSGKQKKQQLRDRKDRVKARKQDNMTLETGNDYESFFVEDQNYAILGAGNENIAAFDVNNSALMTRGLQNANLKLTAALGRQSKDLVEKELSSFFVKETKEQIQLRILESQYPLDISQRGKPLLSKEFPRDPLLDFPKRPSWNYKQSKDKGKMIFTLALNC